MSNVTILVLSIIIFLWIYSIISIITSEFKNKKEKVFWLIAIVFIPILTFFYLYLKKDLLESSTE